MKRENSDIFFTVQQQPVVGFDSGVEAANKKMLTRYSKTKELYLGIVNVNYRVVENEEILFPLQSAMQDFFPNTDTIQIKDTLLKNGAVCWTQYIFPEISSFVETNSNHKTEFCLRIILKNTFDRSGAITMFMGDIDKFCANGMISGTFDLTKQRHTKRFDPDVFTRALAETYPRYEEQIKKYQNYAEIDVNKDKVKELLRVLTITPEETEGKNLLYNKLYDQFEEEVYHRGSNLFALTSAMTSYGSHFTERFPHKKTSNEGTLLNRQEKVKRWLSSPAWQNFLEAA
jgi:hypothetical protein|tara:strand:- start:739 stop:1599 length:861 start_codon:yes stop_codon:yes gene_type:complete